MAEAEASHRAALAARDAASAAVARLRIVAAMLGVQFGAPSVDDAAQTLSMRVDNVRAEAGAYDRPLVHSLLSTRPLVHFSAHPESFLSLTD